MSICLLLKKLVRMSPVQGGKQLEELIGILSTHFFCCEAQGKGRAKGRPRRVTERSFIDGGWWMVDILSLMLYIKFG